MLEYPLEIFRFTQGGFRSRFRYSSTLEALEKSGINSSAVEEVVGGMVYKAGVKGNPARQIQLGAGIPVLLQQSINCAVRPYRRLGGINVKKVVVLGAGTMGAGIALVTAQAGIKVILRDVSESLVQKGLSIIEKNLNKAVEKGKITAEKKAETIRNLIGVYDSEQFAEELQDTDLVIEAIVEKMSVKKTVYKELDMKCPEKTIFATNTSALSISEIASATNRSQKVIGLHFFNPANVMQLVEVIAGASTSPETIDLINDFVKTIGKVPVQVKEAPGFIVNRMLVPMINEAACIYMEEVASAEDIDTAMRLGANHPIGPLALADMIGIDVCLAIMETLYTEFGDPKYRPCQVIKKMVRSGFLGRKTGKGFYQY